MTSGAGAVSAAADRRRIRRAAAAGMVGAVLFVAAFAVQGWLRPGYSAVSMFVSELSAGPYGWIQVLSFMVSGALVLVFGRGLALHFRSGPASRAGPVLVQVLGASLLASGPFLTDPSAPGHPATWHGVVHGAFGAVVFASAPVSCFAFYRRFRTDSAWHPLAAWTLTAGVVLTVGIGLLKLSQQPGTELFGWKGLVQRVLLVTVMSWLFTLAAWLWRRAASPAG